MDLSGSSAYSIERDVKKIQQEILTNGPVEGAFTVFEDFIQYKSGTFIDTLIFCSLHKFVCMYIFISHGGSSLNKTFSKCVWNNC